MGLEIRWIGQYFRPVVVCDHCGELVAEPSDGVYQWRVGANGEWGDGRVFFTHRPCSDAFRLANRGEFSWYGTALECLPLYLGRSPERDLEEARRRAQDFAVR